MADIPNVLWATTADFELSYGSMETLELSELEDPGNNVINVTRIQLFLDQAQDYIKARDRLSCNFGKILIRQNLKRLHLDIARYYADTLKLRPDVEKRYEGAVKYIEDANSKESCANVPFEEELLLYGIDGNNNKIRNTNGQNEISKYSPLLKSGLFRW